MDKKENLTAGRRVSGNDEAQSEILVAILGISVGDVEAAKADALADT